VCIDIPFPKLAPTAFNAHGSTSTTATGRVHANHAKGKLGAAIAAGNARDRDVYEELLHECTLKLHPKSPIVKLCRVRDGSVCMTSADVEEEAMESGSLLAVTEEMLSNGYELKEKERKKKGKGKQSNNTSPTSVVAQSSSIAGSGNELPRRGNGRQGKGKGKGFKANSGVSVYGANSNSNSNSNSARTNPKLQQKGSGYGKPLQPAPPPPAGRSRKGKGARTRKPSKSRSIGSTSLGNKGDGDASFSPALQAQLDRLHNKLESGLNSNNQDSTSNPDADRVSDNLTAVSATVAAGGGALAHGWEEFVTAEGKPYYHHTATQQTSWEKPIG